MQQWCCWCPCLWSSTIGVACDSCLPCHRRLRAAAPSHTHTTQPLQPDEPGPLPGTCVGWRCTTGTLIQPPPQLTPPTQPSDAVCCTAVSAAPRGCVSHCVAPQRPRAQQRCARHALHGRGCGVCCAKLTCHCPSCAVLRCALLCCACVVRPAAWPVPVHLPHPGRHPGELPDSSAHRHCQRLCDGGYRLKGRLPHSPVGLQPGLAAVHKQPVAGAWVCMSGAVVFGLGSPTFHACDHAACSGQRRADGLTPSAHARCCCSCACGRQQSSFGLDSGLSITGSSESHALLQHLSRPCTTPAGACLRVRAACDGSACQRMCAHSPLQLPLTHLARVRLLAPPPPPPLPCPRLRCVRPQLHTAWRPSPHTPPCTP
jgi:hypothetical protein